MIKACMRCGMIVTEEDHRNKRGMSDKYCPHCECGIHPYVWGEEALSVVLRKLKVVENNIEELESIKSILLENECKLREEINNESNS